MLVDLKLKDFVAQVASDSPAPGGGSVAATTAAMGAGLISMLCNLTKTKKGYEEVHAGMAQLADEAERASREFVDIIDEDTKAFDVYMDAIGMPKDTDEQKAARIKAMQDAAKGATLVPLKLAKLAFALIEKAEYAIKFGNKNATSDGAVSVLMLRTAILSAIYNVRINLGGIKDQNFVVKIGAEADELEAEVQQIEQNILKNVTF